MVWISKHSIFQDKKCRQICLYFTTGNKLLSGLLRNTLWRLLPEKEGHFSKVPLGPRGMGFIGGNKRAIAAAIVTATHKQGKNLIKLAKWLRHYGLCFTI